MASEERTSAISVPSSIGSISSFLGSYLGGMLMGTINMTEMMILASLFSISAGFLIERWGRKYEL